MYIKQDLKQNLKEMGIMPHDTLLFHSFMKVRLTEGIEANLIIIPSSACNYLRKLANTTTDFFGIFHDLPIRRL